MHFPSTPLALLALTPLHALPTSPNQPPTSPSAPHPLLKRDTCASYTCDPWQSLTEQTDSNNWCYAMNPGCAQCLQTPTGNYRCSGQWEYLTDKTSSSGNGQAQGQGTAMKYFGTAGLSGGRDLKNAPAAQVLLFFVFFVFIMRRHPRIESGLLILK